MSCWLNLQAYRLQTLLEIQSRTLKGADLLTRHFPERYVLLLAQFCHLIRHNMTRQTSFPIKLQYDSTITAAFSIMEGLRAHGLHAGASSKSPHCTLEEGFVWLSALSRGVQLKGRSHSSGCTSVDIARL